MAAALPQRGTHWAAHPAAGGPPAADYLDPEQAVISARLRKPKAATHWSARRLAQQVGLSSATVHRLWPKYRRQPQRVDNFKFRRTPRFDAQLADIVGLYLDPPERALVLGVDEKSQIQALNRTQPATRIFHLQCQLHWHRLSLLHNG